MLRTENIPQKNSEAIRQAIKQLDVVNYDVVAKLIPGLLADGKLTLDTSTYIPVDLTQVSGIGRYLVYDHPDAANPFSIWAFALGPKQKTSIHDHKYRGTVTVLEGPVSEKYYLPTGEKSAQRIGRADRDRFHTNSDDLKDNFVHQLKRRKGLGDTGTSVTLHIYNMEAKAISPDGEIVDRRNLFRLFTKDKREGVAHYKGKYEVLKRVTPFR